MFPLVGQIFLGLMIGTLAKLIIPGKEPGAVIATALIGLAGSTLGTCFSRIFAGPDHSLGQWLGPWLGWILSVFGALAALAIYWFSIGNGPDFRRRLLRSSVNLQSKEHEGGDFADCLCEQRHNRRDFTKQ